MVACPKRRSVPARHVPARRRRLAEDRRRVERVGGLGPLAGLHPPAAAAAATDRTAKRAPRPAPAPPDSGSPPFQGQHPAAAGPACRHPTRHDLVEVRWSAPVARVPEAAPGCPGRSGGPGITLEHGAAWRWRPAQPLHLTAQPLVVFWSRSRSAPQPLVLAAEPLAFGLQPLLRLAQPGVLLLKPGQTPAQPARACRPRPVCIPLATIDTCPQATTATPASRTRDLKTAQLALGAHRRDQVDPEPVAGAGHHRGAADRHPDRPGVVVRAHPGLIREVDGGAHLGGIGAELG